MTVAGARETVGSPVVQQNGIQCLTARIWTLMPGNAEAKAEIDEQEFEAHYHNNGNDSGGLHLKNPVLTGHPLEQCLYSANHDECVLEYLSRLNPRASAQNKDAKSHNTKRRYVPVEKTSESKKPERLIPKGHRFSHKKTTTVPEKTRTPRSCLRRSKQTLGLSAGTTFNGQKNNELHITADALYNEKDENLKCGCRIFGYRKVQAVEVQKGEEQVKLLDSIKHCFVSLDPPAVAEQEGGSGSGADPEDDLIVAEKGDAARKQPEKAKRKKLLKQSDTLPAKRLRVDHPCLASGTGGKTLASLRRTIPEGSLLLGPSSQANVHTQVTVRRTSKDNEDPGWNTSFKTRRTQKTTSAVEALWKTILRCYLYLLGTLSVGYNPKNWSEKLDDALWAFRTAYKTPTGSKNLFMELNELMELRDGAYKNTYIYKERTKKWHDSRLRGDKNFKVGDKVLLFNSRFKMHPVKLKSKWCGPNVVKTVYPYGTVEITDKNKINFKVNGQRLKKYYDGNIEADERDVIEFKENTMYRDRILHVFPIFCTGPRCKEIDEVENHIIMEYLVKISKKARILELKRRHFKITVLTSYTPYPSRKIWRICACSPPKTTREQDPIRRLRKKYRLSLKNDMPPRDKFLRAVDVWFGVSIPSEQIIMEYLVNISKRRAFWSLNEDILKINYSDNQYAVSIKEDTAYPCLHSLNTTKETSLICRIQERQYVVFKLYENKIFWKISNVVPTPRNSNTPYPIPWIRPSLNDAKKTAVVTAVTTAGANDQMAKTNLQVSLRDNPALDTPIECLRTPS
ncbi:hypothetical protein Tco_1505202 [Tanacetum coccineum]